MAAKAIVIICTQALLIQSAFSQCTSTAAVDASGISAPFNWPGLAATSFAAPGYDRLAAPWAYDGLTAPAWAYDGLAYPGCGRSPAYDGFYSPAMEFTATSGGALPVISSSAMAPVGIYVKSDNAYEGALAVAGELPFVGTTAVEGVVPSAGAGAVNHGCGNGVNAMSALSDTSSPASIATMGSSFTAPGYAYDGFYGSAFNAPAFAYNGLRTPGFAAPAFAYDAYPYVDAASAGRSLACDDITYISPVDAIETTPTRGGALPVASVSAIPPTGIAVASDNAYEGALAVVGELPFVGTVAMEGVVPSAGAGAVNHACGNGRNAMISETTAFAPAGAYAPMAGAFAPGFGPAFPFGYRGDWAARGCGCAF